MKITLYDFIQFTKNQHDVVCNQKYDKKHPYSFHLNLVATVGEKFIHLIPQSDYEIVVSGLWGHDLIEDARITYNNILNITGNVKIAEIIYCCTELRGRNRDERHGQEYLKDLSNNEYATFVKLCDIIANVKYSLLTESGMYAKYKKEFPKLKEKLGCFENYEPMFLYLEKLLNIQ